MPPNLIHYPTLAAECYDTEARSLKKITGLLFEQVYGTSPTPGAPPTTLADVAKAVKGCDTILATSGAFVSTFTPFPEPCLLWQLDCFSIAPSTRWIFIIDFESYQPSQFPVYIAPIYSNCSSSFFVMAPFKRGVTVSLSTAPNFPCMCDPEANMLVTATRRDC